jgi:hypothetical protein
MANGKDHFGEKMRLVRRARENIYFAEKDRQLIKQLRTRLRKAKRPEDEDLKRTERRKDRRRGKNAAASEINLVPRATPRLAPANVRQSGVASSRRHRDYARSQARRKLTSGATRGTS